MFGDPTNELLPTNHRQQQKGIWCYCHEPFYALCDLEVTHQSDSLCFVAGVATIAMNTAFPSQENRVGMFILSAIGIAVAAFLIAKHGFVLSFALYCFVAMMFSKPQRFDLWHTISIFIILLPMLFLQFSSLLRTLRGDTISFGLIVDGVAGIAFLLIGIFTVIQSHRLWNKLLRDRKPQTDPNISDHSREGWSKCRLKICNPLATWRTEMDLTRANFVRGFHNIRQRTVAHDDTSNALMWQSTTGIINEPTSTADTTSRTELVMISMQSSKSRCERFLP